MAWAPYKINFILGFLAIIVPISQSQIAKEHYHETLCEH